MESTQALTCNTMDCLHNKDGSCAFPASITIEEHCCLEYEPKSNAVVVVVQGGLVETVYATSDLKDVQLEILDLDSQEYTDLEEQTREHQRLSQVEQRYIKIY